MQLTYPTSQLLMNRIEAGDGMLEPDHGLNSGSSESSHSDIADDRCAQSSDVESVRSVKSEHNPMPKAIEEPLVESVPIEEEASEAPWDFQVPTFSGYKKDKKKSRVSATRLAFEGD